MNGCASALVHLPQLSKIKLDYAVKFNYTNVHPESLAY